MKKDSRMRPAALAAQVSNRAGAAVDNWISVASWYTLLRTIRLTPGTPLQRLIERRWHSSR